MRTPEEIQHAHDILIAVILDEAPYPRTEEQEKEIVAALDVLCWILGHNHNENFQSNLESTINYIEAQGYRLIDKGTPSLERPTPIKHPLQY